MMIESMVTQRESDDITAAPGIGKMRVLVVHNRYQQPGGEDMVFAAEAALLMAHGHVVEQLVFDNDAIASHRSTLDSAWLAGATIWSRQGHTAVRDAIRTFRPDVVHFHNTFPLISPAGYYAARAEGVPVVQTLHNFRLLCANGLFYRDGHICEDCLGKPVPLPGVVHACYRDSRTASGAVVTMLTAHRALHTWTRMVDRYVVTGEFQRQKFMQGGLPAEKLVVKPNFVPDPSIGGGRGNYALFVGRLSPEKGIRTLLRAWEQLAGKIPLKIAGDGPLAGDVADAQRRVPGIEWLGHVSPATVMTAMQDAALLVFPSEWYEGQPRTILESFAAGTPVVAADLGAMGELIRAGHTGVHFRPGDPGDLARAVAEAFADPTALARMRERKRAEFESRYTAEENYRRLIEIYREVADERRQARFKMNASGFRSA
ncbi:MAG: glycosyltransferase family 4 protein [Thermomicrobiales bacterium]